MRRKLSEEWKASMRLWEKEKDEFERQYPYHCRECGGWGYFGLKKEDIKPCPECVGKMICPLCSEPIEKLEGPPYDKVCTDPDCGWTEHGTKDGSPDPPDVY
jgi:hypothetical protein